MPGFPNPFSIWKSPANPKPDIQTHIAQLAQLATEKQKIFMDLDAEVRASCRANNKEIARTKMSERTSAQCSWEDVCQELQRARVLLEKMEKSERSAASVKLTNDAQAYMASHNSLRRSNVERIASGITESMAVLDLVDETTTHIAETLRGAGRNQSELDERLDAIFEEEMRKARQEEGDREEDANLGARLAALRVPGQGGGDGPGAQGITEDGAKVETTAKKIEGELQKETRKL